MIFNNPNVIKSLSDLKVGGISTEYAEINYPNYINKVEERFLDLVVDYVEFLCSNGLEREQALVETLGMVHNHLTMDITLKSFESSSEEKILEQILVSDQYKSWKSKMFYRFLVIHASEKASTELQYIPVTLNTQTSNESEIEGEETIWMILEGLVAQYK